MTWPEPSQPGVGHLSSWLLVGSGRHPPLYRYLKAEMVQCSSVQFGFVQFCSVLFSFVQFCLVKFSLVQSGSVLFSLFRFSSV